jgi:hypothetical protein
MENGSIDTAGMWAKLKDESRRYPELGYHTLYRAVLDGKIRAEQRGAAWWLWRPDVDLFAAKTAGLRDGVVTQGILDKMDAAMPALRETTNQICKALIAAHIGFRSLEADYQEAVNNGDLTLADCIAEIITHLRAAKVSWDAAASAWRLEIPGIGSALTRSTAPRVSA